MRPINGGPEDMKNFSLHYPSFDEKQRALLAGALAPLRPFGYTNRSNKFQMEPFFYGDKQWHGLRGNGGKCLLLLSKDGSRDSFKSMKKQWRIGLSFIANVTHDLGKSILCQSKRRFFQKYWSHPSLH